MNPIRTYHHAPTGVWVDRPRRIWEEEVLEEINLFIIRGGKRQGHHSSAFFAYFFR